MATDMMTQDEREQYISLIKSMRETAEVAASRIIDNHRIWLHYYDSGVQNHALVQDFAFLISEIDRVNLKNKELHGLLTEARYKVECLGGEPDEFKPDF